MRIDIESKEKLMFSILIFKKFIFYKIYELIKKII